jgi:hypothetical protein
MWITRDRLKEMRKAAEYDDEEDRYVFQRSDPDTWSVEPVDTSST